jgi:putative flippase GtrA
MKPNHFWGKKYARVFSKNKEFLLFALVGGFGTILNTAILYLLTAHAGLHYIFSSVVATEAAIISNFAGNNFLTFKNYDSRKKILPKFGKFQLISLLTIIGTVLVLWLLTSTLGQKYLLVWNFVAILLMFVANFALNKKFTWNSASKAKGRPPKLIIILLGVMLLSGLASASTVTSQVGYHPDSYKQVIVYTSDTSGTYSIIDASSGNTASSGSLSRPINSSGQSGSTNCQGNRSCLVADFSNFTTSGTFYITSSTPGHTSSSYNFDISSSIHEDSAEVLLEFYNAMLQQDSSYHSDMHSYLDPPFLMTADGSFLMTSSDASVGLARLSYAYNNNPDMFSSIDNYDITGNNIPDIAEYIKTYSDYIVGLQGLEIEELTDGSGFRLNPAVEIHNAFSPNSGGGTVTIYTNTDGDVLKTVNIVNLCSGSSNTNQCISDASTYFKCQTGEVCLNGTYIEKTGRVSSTAQGFAVMDGWVYEFGCYFDVDNDDGIFNNGDNPCMIFDSDSSADNTAKAFFALANSLPAIDDYYGSTASEDLFNRVVDTYYFMTEEYSDSELSDSEVSAYLGSGLFRLYDYTSNTTFLSEAAALSDNVDTDFDLWKTHGNEFYWYEYLMHEDDFSSASIDFDESMRDVLSDKMFGEWKDEFLAISKNGERVVEKHRDFNFANSRSMLITAVFSARTHQLLSSRGDSPESFLMPISESQWSWITGANEVQNGTASSNQSLSSMSFVVGLGENHPREIHSRYLMSTEYKDSSSGSIVGARGTGYYFLDSSSNSYEYFDGMFNILGYTLGAMGNGLNGESKINEFNNSNTLNNGEITIPGWINGPFDISGDNDVILNYDDTRYTYEFTESTQETVSSAIELLSYLDGIRNSASPHDGLSFTLSESGTDEGEDNGNSTNQTINNSTNSTSNNSTNQTNSTIPSSNSTNQTSSNFTNSTGNSTNSTSSNNTATNSTSNNSTNQTGSGNTNNTNNSSNQTQSSGSNSLIVSSSSLSSSTFYETQNISFSVTLASSGDVNWYVDGVLKSTTLGGTAHSFNFNPGILYTSNFKDAQVVASSSNNVSWSFSVENVINPFFDPTQSSSSSSTIHVFTNDKFDTYDSINVSIQSVEGSSIVTKTYALVPTVAGNNETDWKLLISDFSVGTNYLVRINTFSQRPLVFTILTSGDIRAFERASSTTTSSQGGGGGGSSSSGGSLSSGTPALIYAILASDVATPNSSQTITIDAKGGISRAVALLVGPDGSTRRINLTMTKGDNSYGTWSKNFSLSDFSSGLYTLSAIELNGRAYNVSKRAFYVAGSEVLSGENLMLVYIVLSQSRVSNPQNVTLSLDARDFNGLVRADAFIRIIGGGYPDDLVTLSLNLSNGNSKYGTWSGEFFVNRPDSTYIVDKIILYNNETSKEYGISARSVYATDDLPVIPGRVIANSPITGLSIFGNVNRPVLPVLIALGILLVAGAVIVFGPRVKRLFVK